MKQNKYHDESFFNKYSIWIEQKNGLKGAGEWQDFIFSVEHPIFTAQGPQAWYCDDKGNILHWPVDHYFDEGIGKAKFLGEEVIKYHRSFTSYLNSLIRKGFEITGVVEPEPAENMLNTVAGMLDELGRPMMLLISARKK